MPLWPGVISGATDNAVPRFDGTSGSLQASGVTISDTNTLSVTGGALSGSGSAGQMSFSATGAMATSALLITRGSSAGYNPSGLEVYAGNAEAIRIDSSQNFGLCGGLSAGGGTKVVFVANASVVPASNPTGGGILYVEAGALKYRGSSGTVTTVAPA